MSLFAKKTDENSDVKTKIVELKLLTGISVP